MIDRRVLLTLPFAGAVAVGGGFWLALQRMQAGSLDPRGIPSPLVGRKLPDFTLPAQAPAAQGFTSAEILAAAAQRPVLVNFFASWCVPCVIEQPQLMALQKRGIPLWGVAYKDTAEAAARFLAQRGDPYTRLARDELGRTAIDFGLYGVPETYFIDRQGVVRWRWAGPMDADTISRQLDPLLQKYA
jgi:cytochrome c biogenesis protein CcmG, thiol:disulfide interchange protein DsbE